MSAAFPNPGWVLITGGAGFLGSHLADRFLAAGRTVTCLDNLSTGDPRNLAGAMRHERLTFVEADIRAPLQTDASLIVNLASPASPVDYQRDPVGTAMTNALGAHQVLEAARRSGARVIQASTSEIYGDPDVPLQAETYIGRLDPLSPRACYNEGKRFAETLCVDYRRQYGVQSAIVRIFNTYGPRMREADGRVISNFIVAALRGRPLAIYGDGRQTRSFCYVDDLIDGFEALTGRPDIAGPLNLGNPEEIAIAALAERIVALTGSRSPIERRAALADDPRQRRPDITAARAALDWVPRVTLEDGLKRTIAYFDAVLSKTPSSSEYTVAR